MDDEKPKKKTFSLFDVSKALDVAVHENDVKAGKGVPAISLQDSSPSTNVANPVGTQASIVNQNNGVKGVSILGFLKDGSTR